MELRRIANMKGQPDAAFFPGTMQRAIAGKR